MNLIDRGSGPPLVLIPGLQGRWEYLRPAVDALSASFRVLTFSLDSSTVRLRPDATYETKPDAMCTRSARLQPSERRSPRGSSSVDLEPDTTDGLDRYADQVADVMTGARVERAMICGVSFGGLIAVRFAAQYPTRCQTLILASTPPPRPQLRRRHRVYVRAPWIFGPLFLAETPWRLRSEVRAAIPGASARLRFSLRALGTVVSAPLSLSHMAARARMMSTVDVGPDCARITTPTLVVTGERDLDRIVPVDGSAEYLGLIPNARAVVIERTGHLGSITRPDAFAAIVRDFAVDAGADPRVRPDTAHGSTPTGRVA